MKKEIEVWIKDDEIYDFSRMPLGDEKHLYTEATLIIDVPEPKIEITPSKLKQILARASLGIYTSETHYKAFRNNVCFELFGEDYE